jgi:KH/beta-lactamase-domain protein
MGDILKTILSNLPEKVIDNANFEGANIVVYTSDKKFFVEGEQQIRDVVNKIKKRVELRASESILMDKEATEKFIRETVPKEADIQDILFDEERGIVALEVKRPGIAIGHGGEILRTIKEKTFWIPQTSRTPAIQSKITDAIRHTLFVKEAYRKKFLNTIGKRIYKEWSPEKKEEWVRVSVLGAGRQVGRSCFLIQTPESRILLDCGVDIAAQNSDKFPYLNAPEVDINRIDAVILSHAHLDHSGFLPYLYKLGYRGPCYMTAPTRDIAALLALDFIGVAYKKASAPLFGAADVKMMVKHSIDLNYNEVTDITPDVRLTLYNAGHALGSSMIHLNIGNGLHNLLYTADFKFIKQRALDPAMFRFPRLETLIIESTYGGKENVLPTRAQAEEEFISAVKKTIEDKGKVLVPVLGVGRAQEMMLIVENAVREGLIPNVPIYVDGMVWDITAIHTAYPEFLSSNLRTRVFQDENPFDPELFKRVGSPEERKKVLEGGPCIILATSGMLVGGASMEYFKSLADSKRNAIIFVSYLGPGSLGRAVQEGLKEFKPEDSNENIPINLQIYKMDGLTGHAGRNELINFVNNVTPIPRRIIVNHGEQSKCLDLASTIYKLNKIETIVPRNLEAIRIR